MSIVSALFPETFFSFDNFKAIFNNLIFGGLMAVGMTVVMVGGGFDLSIGFVITLSAIIACLALRDWELGIAQAILIGLVVALCVGMLKGSVIAKIGVNPLITTIATMGAVRGVTVLIGGREFFYLLPGIEKMGQTQVVGHESK